MELYIRVCKIQNTQIQLLLLVKTKYIKKVRYKVVLWSKISLKMRDNIIKNCSYICYGKEI